MLMKKQNYVIICDESTKKGSNFSYFYGGAMLQENKYDKISKLLEFRKSEHGLHEMKRIKITEKNYKDYINVLELFFVFVKSGDIKMRIMFSPNDQLSFKHNTHDTFMKFYYTFIINAFNIFYAKEDFNLRLICDDLPETKDQCKLFKKCIINKIRNNDKVNTNKVYINRDRIEEVDSQKHVILQCVDVIVGLTDFYLNTSKEDIKKSKRARARLYVWEYICSQIMCIDENFQLTKTTQPIFSHKGWKGQYKHFVYKQK